MMSCDKNKLQEWCHSHSVDFPTYESTSLSGHPSHSPVWVTKVNFMGNEYSAEGKNKKEAEKEAARKILAIVSLIEKKEEIKEDIILQNNEEMLSEWMIGLKGDVFFVDVDNYNIDTKSIRDSEDKFFLLFGGKTNRRKLISFSGLPNAKIFICDSLIKDGTDHLMTFYLGRVYQVKLQRKELESINFYILTRDHFGEAIARFVNGVHLVDLF